MSSYKYLIVFTNWGIGASLITSLLASGFRISAVVTQYDIEKESEPYFNIVYHTAKKNCLAVFLDHASLLCGNIRFYNTIAISVAYNRIFDDMMLDKLSIINFHPSCLPDYRGPSPIAWQILDHRASIGFSAHFVSIEIDAGDMLANNLLSIDYTLSYEAFIDRLNTLFINFIIQTIEDFFCNRLNRLSISQQCTENNYYPRLSIPDNIKHETLDKVSSFLNRPRLILFTGNRAEFGIMFPLIMELSSKYYVTIVVSGAHVIKPWYTISEIEEKINALKVPVTIVTISLKNLSDLYAESLPRIYTETIKLLDKKYNYRFAIVLGDRIETMGFSLCCFYKKIPIIHINGGDVANVPFFDTNVRHSISKLSHIHLVTNDLSMTVLLQLGEESWRVHNIGNISYDYDRLGLIDNIEVMTKEFGLDKNNITIIYTYHPAHNKNDEDNLEDFIIIYDILESSGLTILITYPNNDPGGKLILAYLEDFKTKNMQNVVIIPNLGTLKLLSLFKNFKVIAVGNSSSFLMETALYSVPVINIGERQTDRCRGANVIDCSLNKEKIRDVLNIAIYNYDKLRLNFATSKNFFGDGTASLKAMQIIDTFLNKQKEEMLLKKFIISKQ
ncbi:UDP-N-acetyl-D-glucosamine 2-epimerase [Candidatus Magnetobacterium bavaricum]|uniref:UDP-N-acetyl-D-glucosamine 2-epimerase n=1 Tax=Candidatus Magnetobacterium bavaricum TaxID=29290 RepID=A0A0F3GL15_9BACT|nr:UDP-N-acetyl-D-glucosamine 2-epimerase [Candidatus Magnetobacterium bavaricum]